MEEPCRSAASEERSQEVFFGLEKRQMQGARQMQKGEEEGWKLKVKGKADAEGRRRQIVFGSLLFGVGGGFSPDFRMSIRQLGLGLLSYCGIYTTGSVHRFKWSNQNRTEPARFYGFKIGLIGFLSRFGFLG